MSMTRRSRPRQLVDIVRRSLRRGRIAVMVLHTTEGHNRPGVGDLTGLAAFFKTVQADSTFGVDQEGFRIRMKPDSDSPWTQLSANHRSLSIEQVGFASTSRKGWIVGYHNGLRTVAEILADWSEKHKLPIVHSASKGVCGHVELPAQTHTDPGRSYPYKYIVWWARYIKLHRQGKYRRAKVYAKLVERTQRREGVKSPTTWYR